MAELRVVTALRLEALAVGGRVSHAGPGRRRALAAGRRLAAAAGAGDAVAVVGVAGGLDRSLRPGQLVVATEVWTADGSTTVRLPSAEVLADELRRSGFDVQSGPIVSSPRFVRPSARAALAERGALAVDMESAWIADQLRNVPVAVVRAVADTPGCGLVSGGIRALAALRGVRPVLERWALATGDRRVRLAAPRSFCAGVERAIEIVERAIERYGAPVYVRRQIVHNAHVVAGLERKGAVFVEEIDDVPAGATVVLAAHGVAPDVRNEAADRGDLAVIDATCPLVAKVHHEARRFAAQGRQIVLVGHAEHEEVVGTVGEAPEQIHVVGRPDEVAGLPFATDDDVAYLTQTTLATDETGEIVEALRARFPRIVGPSADDICYATQNRQDAVRSLARKCELVLVVGSSNSSNTARLVEVARREGCRAELVEDASELRLDWLDQVETVGLTAGASAPEILVQQLVDRLATLGHVEVDEHRTTQETVRFALPQQVR